jgi:hypothetical protein
MRSSMVKCLLIYLLSSCAWEKVLRLLCVITGSLTFAYKWWRKISKLCCSSVWVLACEKERNWSVADRFKARIFVDRRNFAIMGWNLIGTFLCLYYPVWGETLQRVDPSSERDMRNASNTKTDKGDTLRAQATTRVENSGPDREMWTLQGG